MKVEKNEGRAYIQLTDIKKRICLPLSDVHQYVIFEETKSDSHSKRFREDLEHSKWKKLVAPPSMPVNGYELEEFILKINQACHSLETKPGTKVWVNLGSANGKWPAIVWALQFCRKDDLPDVILTYKAGRYLVNFYGEHSLMWIKEKQMSLAIKGDESDLYDTLVIWGKKHKK